MPVRPAGGRVGGGSINDPILLQANLLGQRSGPSSCASAMPADALRVARAREH
jgi:hypothetical protein